MLRTSSRFDLRKKKKTTEIGHRSMDRSTADINETGFSKNERDTREAQKSRRVRGRETKATNAASERELKRREKEKRGSKGAGRRAGGGVNNFSIIKK